MPDPKVTPLFHAIAQALFAESRFPEHRLPGMADALTKYRRITDALGACGVYDFIRALNRVVLPVISAGLAPDRP